MAVLVASDLDRTLIYSAKALHLDVPDDEAPLLTVSEVYQGAPLSYMTRRAQEDLVELAAETVFVPVTTRTTAQFRRVRLPLVRFDYAVTTNGGTLLHQGEADPEWASTVATRLRSSCAPLAEIEALVALLGDVPWILRVSRAEEHFVYAIVERELLTGDLVAAASLAALTLDIEQRGWTVSLQGRKLYLVPAPLTKSAAIAEVAVRVGADRVLAAGDSLLDLDLLESADRSFRPAHGELHELGIVLPHLVTTNGRGVRAGEEIIALLRAEAGNS